MKEIIVTELGERKVPAFKNRELPEGEEFVIQTHLKKRKLDETRTAYMLSGNMLQWEGDELAVRFETFYLGNVPLLLCVVIPTDVQGAIMNTIIYF